MITSHGTSPAVAATVSGNVTPPAATARAIAFIRRPRSPGNNSEAIAFAAVFIPAENAFRSVPVWDRYALPPEWQTTGPAVIEEIESTTIVMPAFDVAVDGDLNVVLRRKA